MPLHPYIVLEVARPFLLWPRNEATGMLDGLSIEQIVLSNPESSCKPLVTLLVPHQVGA